MKIIVSIFLLSLPYFAAAQFSKGQVYLGGSMTASSSHNDSNSPNVVVNPDKNSSLSISPVLGYFLSPNLAVGGTVGYSTSSSESSFVNTIYDNNNNPINVNANSKTVTKGFTVGSFARYYVPISNSFYFAAQGQINFTRSNSNYTLTNGAPVNQEVSNQTPSYAVAVTIKPVFIFFPSPKWGIEASVGSLGYNYQRELPDVHSSTTFSLGAGQFSFGLAYYFARKAK